MATNFEAESGKPESNELGSIKMINLLNLNDQEKKELKANILASRGAIQIWVHSHDNEGQKGSDKDAANLSQYLSKRDKMITQSLKSKLPILALIGSMYKNEDTKGETLARYTSFYNKHVEKGEKPTIYFLETLTDRSTPLIVRSEELAPDYNSKYDEENWDRFYEMLKELGVNTVIVRGRNLRFKMMRADSFEERKKGYLLKNFSTNYNDKGELLVQTPAGCVGHTLVNLGKKGMDVRLSKVVHLEK